jgi:amino acid permease
MMEALLIVALAVVAVTLVTAGAVLLLHFWVRRVHPTVRVLLAALVGAGLFLLPIWFDGADFVVYLAVLAGAGVLSFPTAYLATRKLERTTENVFSAFE